MAISFQPRRSSLIPFIFAQLLLLSPLTIASAQPRPTLDAAELQLALKKLTVMGSALHIAAHPDDENTAMLAYLANERGVRTGYLSLTRGDGGQNLIGTEKGDLLGVIRTQELLAARRVDGAEQFFTRAIDFGFSKSPEETLAKWGREEVLSDVVWVIRRFRPDVVITRFPADGRGGHGHHTASGILAEEAFRIAGDATRFPEQLKYVQPWQPKRLMWNSFSFRQGRPSAEPAAGAPPSKHLLRIDLGTYNPVLGRSYTEIAADSRSMHKSQGFGSAERRGTALNYFQPVLGGGGAAAGDAPTKDLFDGVDLSWSRVAGGSGERVGQLLEEARRAYEAAKNPSAILPLLIRAHAEMRSLPPAQQREPLVEIKRRELLEVIRACAGLWIEAITEETSTTPGGQVSIATTLVNRSEFPLTLESIVLPYGNPARPVNTALRNNQPLITKVDVRVPMDHDYTQPYWLRNADARSNIAQVSDQLLIGQPENPPTLPIIFTIKAADELLSFETEAVYRFVDRVRGEQYRPFEIVPDVTVSLDANVYLFADAKPKQIKLMVKSNTSNLSGALLRLRAPEGYRIAPEQIPINLKAKNDETIETFTVTPSSAGSGASFGVGRLAAEVSVGTRRFTRNLAQINYEHIRPQTLLPLSEANLVRLDVQKRGERLGYIMGSGDDLPPLLAQLGYDVTLLRDEDLDTANLKNFDAIITGVRAYNTRERLKGRQTRLLEYVEAGGTLVVQYNTAERDSSAVVNNLGPYPFRLSSERVTVEEAPVKFLLPQDAVLNTPNKITAADFEGWVQERGLYFPGEWDRRYAAPLASSDPGEPDRAGGLLVARYGKGTYIYTGYAFFRQLPAGVPGAYRLFVNLISAGK